KETTGVLPPEVEEGIKAEEYLMSEVPPAGAAAPVQRAKMRKLSAMTAEPRSAVSSAPAQVRERKIGDLFEYEIEHLVTIRRNQSALVPIVLRPFEGRPVLLYNKQTRVENPMRCVDV